VFNDKEKQKACRQSTAMHASMSHLSYLRSGGREAALQASVRSQPFDGRLRDLEEEEEEEERRTGRDFWPFIGTAAKAHPRAML
jgi:hypothetical protein